MISNHLSPCSICGYFVDKICVATKEYQTRCFKAKNSDKPEKEWTPEELKLYQKFLRIRSKRRAAWKWERNCSEARTFNQAADLTRLLGPNIKWVKK